MGNKPDLGAYVQRVREDTHRYARDLLDENEKLRAALVSMAQENERLRSESTRVRVEIEQVAENARRLKEVLSLVEAENRRFSSRYVEVEQENSNLANLYVASYRLHGTVERREILEVIQEIVANLIGSEEMAVFELSADGAALSLLTSFGIDPGRFRSLALGTGIIGRAAVTGETYLAGDVVSEEVAATDTDLTACVPLKVGGRVMGALTLFRLLPQKPGIEPLDRELFELLATHAGTALYCSGLEARLAASVA
jgi:regulator of replication initiation timing